jgi:cobalt/nickel transport system permease protein
MDARVRLVAAVAGVAAAGVLPPGAFLWAALLMICALALASRIPASYFYLRASVVTPFILTMGAFRLLAGVSDTPAGLSVDAAAIPASAAVIVKGYAAVVLLSLLVATSGIARILWALESLHAPRVVVLVSNLMFRYFDLLLDEWAAMNRARASRGGDRLKLSRIRILASEIGLLFVRSWERAERVHQAMLSRGFTGSLPGRGVERRFSGNR